MSAGLFAGLWTLLAGAATMVLVGKPHTSATACAMSNLLNRAGPPMLYILHKHHQSSALMPVSGASGLQLRADTSRVQLSLQLFCCSAL